MASNVQSFIQPIAQANSPFLANNGNPGTVYNMPNTGSYKPPMSSALNQWALNPTPASAYAGNPFWLNGGGNAPAGPTPTFVVPELTTIPGSVIPTNPGGGTTPPPTPPVVGPPAGPSGGGPRGGGEQPRYGPEIWAGGTTGGGGAKAPGGGFAGIGNALKNLSWQEVLDTVIGGDLYDSDSGTWDITNGVAAALNQVFPGLGTAAQWAMNQGLLGQKLQDFAFNESYRQFEARQAKNINQVRNETGTIMEQRAIENANRRAAERANLLNPGGTGWNNNFNAGNVNNITGGSTQLGASPFDNAYTGTINDRMNMWGVGGTQSDGGGRSVGGNTIASGAAAIGMAEGLQRAAQAGNNAAIQQQIRNMIKIK